MPVRKVPRGRLTVTGSCPAGKSALPAEYESPLERDLFLLLESEPGVLSFEPQPLWIEIPGRKKPYPPDVKVEYLNVSEDHHSGQVIVEVKPRRDLWDDWAKLRRKFKASIHDLDADGIRFKVVTEKEIRTLYARNRAWLRPHLRGPLGEGASSILRDVESQPGVTVGSLVEANLRSPVEPGRFLWTIWQCAARGLVEVDLGDPLSLATQLYPQGFGLPRTHITFPSFRLIKSVFT